MTKLNSSNPAPTGAAANPKEMALKIARTQPPIRGLGPHHREEGWRETVESIVIAFVLAFLFRTFVAEAFVIPTGSMAETLYGRHKDVVCSQCQNRYRVGASEELDRVNGYFLEEARLQYGFCPNCNYRMNITDEPVFKGDRILVNKFPYELSDPKPWDVVVFKYPVDPKVNFIKRLIGLPGQQIEIEWGDIYRQEGDGEWHILRKPPDKQPTMQGLVYDDAKPPKALVAQGYPERWEALAATGDTWQTDASGWQADREQRSYQVESAAESTDLKWLRYRHFLPTVDEWQRALEGGKLVVTPDPLLISDFYGYNGGYLMGSGGPVTDWVKDMCGEYWVGDLTVNAQVEVLEARGELLLELIESTRRYRCGIDLRTGKARLHYQDDIYRGSATRSVEDVVLDEGDTPLSKPGKYRIRFANVDDRLCLWVNDRLVAFPNRGEYPFSPRTSYRLPTQQDLCPVGIAAKGASVRVSHLLLQRDLYYTDARRNDVDDVDYRRSRLRDPEKYGDYASHFKPHGFVLDEDEFLVLGDNSPRSADSRAWPKGEAVHPYAVPRELLIGKAFFIYWPHGVPFLNHGKGYAPRIGPLASFFYHMGWDHRRDQKYLSDYPANSIPFYPQFSRMHFIR